MNTIYVPRDLHEYQTIFNSTDALLYSFLLSKGGLEYEVEVSAKWSDFREWVKVSPSAFYASLQKLISLNLVNRTKSHTYIVFDYKGNN